MYAKRICTSGDGTHLIRVDDEALELIDQGLAIRAATLSTEGIERACSIIRHQLSVQPKQKE